MPRGAYFLEFSSVGVLEFSSVVRALPEDSSENVGGDHDQGTPLLDAILQLFEDAPDDLPEEDVTMGLAEKLMPGWRLRSAIAAQTSSRHWLAKTSGPSRSWRGSTLPGSTHSISGGEASKLDWKSCAVCVNSRTRKSGTSPESSWLHHAMMRLHTLHPLA